jgi:hypothetical protein
LNLNIDEEIQKRENYPGYRGELQLVLDAQLILTNFSELHPDVVKIIQLKPVGESENLLVKSKLPFVNNRLFLLKQKHIVARVRPVNGHDDKGLRNKPDHDSKKTKDCDNLAHQNDIVLLAACVELFLLFLLTLQHPVLELRGSQLALVFIQDHRTAHAL